MTETLTMFIAGYQHPDKKRRRFALCESPSWERAVRSLERVVDNDPYKDYKMVYVKRGSDITR